METNFNELEHARDRVTNAFFRTALYKILRTNKKYIGQYSKSPTDWRFGFHSHQFNPQQFHPHHLGDSCYLHGLGCRSDTMGILLYGPQVKIVEEAEFNELDEASGCATDDRRNLYVSCVLKIRGTVLTLHTLYNAKCFVRAVTYANDICHRTNVILKRNIILRLAKFKWTGGRRVRSRRYARKCRHNMNRGIAAIVIARK